jgi:short-subunit dehydrogenase
MWTDKVTIVTGASSGIGAAIAQLLSTRGARVVLVARRRDRLDEVAARCTGPGPLVVTADVTRREDCERVSAEVVAAFGVIDCLILNAGIDVHAKFLELSPEQADQIVRTNLSGPLDLTRACLPHLLERRGTIGVMSSLQGKTGFPGSAVYAGSKHALHGFFDSLRMELAGSGVSITLICPGAVESEIRPAQGKYDRAMMMSAERCAELAVHAIERRRREEVLTLAGKLGVLLRPFWPGLIDRIVQRKIDEFYG